MAAIPSFRFDITGATGSTGFLTPKNGWRAYILPRGANASQDSTGTLITFDSAAIASRFAVNNWIQVGLSTDNQRRVSAVGGNSIGVAGSAITVTENNRVFLIGNTQPTVSGGSATYTIPNTLVRQRGDDGADLFTNSMITSNSDGLIQGYAAPAMYDVLVQDGNQANQGFIADMEVGTVEGVSVTDAAYFGSTVTFSGNQVGISSSGVAVFGATVTFNGTIGVTNIAIIPRLGPYSTATTGGAIRIIEGVRFPFTVAGVQAALDECETAGGGLTIIPSNAGVSLSTTSVKIPSRCKLIGTGQFTSVGTFIAGSTTNMSAAIENKTQDGTQQFAYVDSISIAGNRLTGATVTAGIRFENVYDGSAIVNCVIDSCSGNGILLDGTTNNLGPILVDTCSIGSCGNDNILLTGRAAGVRFRNITSGHQAAGRAALRIENNESVASFGHTIEGFYTEQDGATDLGIVLDGVANCLVLNAVANGASGISLVRITGTSAGSDGAGAAGGHVLMNLTGNFATIIDDQTAGVSVSNAQGRFVRWYSSPIVPATDLDTSQVVGLQLARAGTLVSGTSIAPNASNANFFTITGTSVIQTIVANQRYSGKDITLMFSNVAGGSVGTGGNVRLAGGASFAAAQWDCITLTCSGSTWFEGSPR